MKHASTPVQNHQTEIKGNLPKQISSPDSYGVQPAYAKLRWAKQLKPIFYQLKKSLAFLLPILLLSASSAFAQFDNDPAPFVVWGVNDQNVFVINGANPTYPNDVSY